MKEFMFKTWGFVLCWLKGRSREWPWLIAQARVETGRLTSHWFTNEKNPWCMHVGSKSGRRTGGIDADGGQVAIYGSYRAAWVDRLAWGRSWEGPQSEEVMDWLAREKTEGGWATGMSTNEYLNAILLQFNELPEKEQGFGTVKPSALHKALPWVAVSIAVALVVWVFWVFYNVRRSTR